MSRSASNEPDDFGKDDAGPSGWLVTEPNGQKHLPTRSGGTPDHKLLGAAWAALHGGYRGQQYSGPDKAGAIARLKALYGREGLPTPGEKSANPFASKALVRKFAEAPRFDANSYGNRGTPANVWPGGQSHDVTVDDATRPLGDNDLRLAERLKNDPTKDPSQALNAAMKATHSKPQVLAGRR